LASSLGDPGLRLAPLRASIERVFDISVCLRPFRPGGPRLDAEQVGDTLVVHNYGHGGSGWSLSWGSSAIAVGKALAGSPRALAVLGCGPLGLTSALLAQSAGIPVTIYARELAPEVASMRATGTFTPHSRIALADVVDPGFGDKWEQMARTSLKRCGTLLGLPGEPVRWIDRYSVNNGLPRVPPPARTNDVTPLRFAEYEDRLADVMPGAEELPATATPFGVPVQRQPNLMFNLASYAHTLLTMFRLAGGRMERREFHSAAELAQLPEKTVVNCTGLGAQALFGDATLVPVRGQIAWLIPQREFDYAVYHRAVNVVPRSDGIAVQALSGGDMRGYGNSDTTPDHAEAAAAVAALEQLYARFGKAGPTNRT
jgi:glycine/D-amino acid oxidase-like deaminating enzyme